MTLAFAPIRRLARALVLVAIWVGLASVERASAQPSPAPTFCPPAQLTVTGNCCTAGQMPQSDGSCAAPSAPAVLCPANQVSAGNFCTSCLPNQVASGNACVTPAGSQCGGAPTVTVNGYLMCCPAGDSASNNQCANNPYTTDGPVGCATSQITTSGTCCPAGESATAGGTCCPSGQLTGANTCCPSGTAPQSDNTCAPSATTTSPQTWPAACPIAQLSNTGTCCPAGQAPTINGSCVVPPTSCPQNQVLSNNACICPFPQLMQADGSCFAGCPAGTNQVLTNGMYSCVAPPGCPAGQFARTNPGGGFTCLCSNGGGLPVNGSCTTPVPPPTCGPDQTAQPNAGGNGFTCVCANSGQAPGPNGSCVPPPTCGTGQTAKLNPSGTAYTCVCANSGQPPGPNGVCGPPPCNGRPVPPGTTCTCPILGEIPQPNGTCGLPLLAPCHGQGKVLRDGKCICGPAFITERNGECRLKDQSERDRSTNPPPSCRDGHCTTKRNPPARPKKYIFRRGGHPSTGSPTERRH